MEDRKGIMLFLSPNTDLDSDDDVQVKKQFLRAAMKKHLKKIKKSTNDKEQGDSEADKENANGKCAI